MGILIVHHLMIQKINNHITYMNMKKLSEVVELLQKMPMDEVISVTNPYDIEKTYTVGALIADLELVIDYAGDIEYKYLNNAEVVKFISTLNQ